MFVRQLALLVASCLARLALASIAFFCQKWVIAPFLSPVSLLSILCMQREQNYPVPVVPHKAVAEVSKIGNL